MRLQRALARAGVASRRAAEELIRAGRVHVNGRVAELGSKVDLDADVVTVRGRRIRPAAESWMAFHKPVKVLVSRHDKQGRLTVFDLLPDSPGLTYVGRLDFMTSGLLLLTTDGETAHRLMHPRYAVARTYRARVHGLATAEIVRRLEQPVVIDGRPTRIDRVSVRAVDGGRTDMQLTLSEGRYRIVRRVCDSIGLRVEQLARLSYGPVSLGRMPPGKWRMLSRKEIRAIKTSVGARIADDQGGTVGNGNKVKARHGA